MNCLDCHPHATPALAICGRCGAGLCAEHIVESDDHLTFTAPINRSVAVRPAVRRLRCARCAAAERTQALHEPYDEADSPHTTGRRDTAERLVTRSRVRARRLREFAAHRT